MTNWERLNKEHAKVTQQLEAARLREGTEAMRGMLETLGFYQMSPADLTQFERTERVRVRQAPREEETGPGAAGGDAAPDAAGDSAGRDDVEDVDEDDDQEDERAAQPSVRDEADDSCQADHELAGRAAERAPRLAVGPRSCQRSLGLRGLLQPKKRQRH